MNVVVVNDYAFVNGGATRVAILSANALAQRGVRVHFFAAVGPPADSLRDGSVQLHLLDRKLYADRGAVFSGLWDGEAKSALDRVLAQLPREETVVHVH